jgi:predicted nucleic acid-binding protein
VVDASVAAKYFEEPGSEAADRLLADQTAGGRDLLAPDLIVPEFTNVLWRKLSRGECSAGDADDILEAFETDRPALVPSSALAPRALGLARALGHSVYDCLYVAAAIELGAGLATADARLAHAARSLLAELEWVR